VPTDVEAVEQPRDREEATYADDDVDDVGERAASEHVRDHVRVEEADHSPIESADDQHQQGNGLEPLDHLHLSPPWR
jgi:hypothetical protein